MPFAPRSNKGYDIVMSTVDEIKDALQQLPPEELAAFRSWFAEFDAGLWDRQFEEDVAAGRLDRLAEEAIEDLREGRCTDL
jgi:hypothetical protein